MPRGKETCRSGATMLVATDLAGGAPPVAEVADCFGRFAAEVCATEDRFFWGVGREVGSVVAVAAATVAAAMPAALPASTRRRLAGLIIITLKSK